jgi:hypothetical protein
MADTLLEALRATRKDYASERVWHRFLLDAYSGCGGFAGKVKPPASGYLGWAAEVYAATTASGVTGAASSEETYLDRFPREDDPKFARRQDVAHYVNYTGPIVDLFASYLVGQPPTRGGVDGEIAEWLQNADGRGTTWDELKSETIMPRALTLGWCPVMFDRDAQPAEVTSKAHEKALDIRTRAIPMFPANLTQWECDESGALTWAKVCIGYTAKPDPLGPELSYEKILIWTRYTVSEYNVVRDDRGRETVTVARKDERHGFGEVPIIVFRAGRVPEDAVRGLSMVGGVAVENRRHFNALSELDEHLRSTVFAILQVPIPPGTQKPDELLTGNGNALPVPSDASQGYQFIAPPQSVADTYETRLKESVREIYRIASAPFENDSGSAQSGTSRAFQFDGTNKRLVKIATGLASAEQRALRLVGTSQGATPDTVGKVLVTPPAEFRIDDLSVDLENLVKAIGLAGMSATAKMLLILRNVEKMLPNMSADDRAKIETELLAARDAALKATAEAEKPRPSADDQNQQQAA